MAGIALTDAEWAVLLARLPGRAFYAVKTTGVVCRTGCPARTPLRRNVLRFDTVAAATAAGFRPCKRCKPLAEDGPAGGAGQRLDGFGAEFGVAVPIQPR